MKEMEELSSCKVLIVDDTEENVDILVEALGELYDVSVAMDGRGALEAVSEDRPDIILLDIMMPEMDGYSVCSALKSDPATADIPVVFLTALTEIENKTRGFELGAVDYITKPFEVSEIKMRVQTHLFVALSARRLKRQNEILELKVQERTRELSRVQEATIESLAALAEYRDPETGGHIKRTQHYMRALARALKTHPKFEDVLDETTIHYLFLSAPLHDIGKVGVRDGILLKPDSLTENEMDQMKAHPLLGKNAISVAEKKLEGASFLRYAREIAYCHHERWDGNGYPQGLSGTAIPVSARLMTLVDVYDALISRRVYKTPFTHAESVRIIEGGRGTMFDPDIVDAFLEIQEEFRSIALKFADFDDERDALSEKNSRKYGGRNV
jgi:putative two-component system response regulator